MVVPNGKTFKLDPEFTQGKQFVLIDKNVSPQ
jgi:hypothetical protein